VLEVLEGLIGVLAGIGLMVLGAFVGSMFGMGMLGDFVGALAGVMGGVALIFGLISFLLAYGLLKGRGWAWTVSLVFAILGLIFGILQLVGSPGSGVLQVIISAIIVYYLYRPNVKAFFGKGSAPTA
jgi:uncharacterized membrane protein (DUF2068 family)